MTAVAKRRWTLAFLTIGFGLIALVLPFSGDDLMWGGQPGLNLLHSLFYDYNGRLFSNIVMIAVTRVTALRVIVYAASSVGLTYLIAALGFRTRHLQGWQLMLTAGLLLTMSQEIFAQTFGWLSGFINYIAGMVPLLFVVAWMQHTPKKKTTTWQALLMAVLGVLSALVVEHITLYLLLLGIFGLVYVIKKQPMKRSGMIGFLIGVIFGAILMFRDPSYLEAFTGNNFNRKLALGQKVMDQLVQTYTDRMYRYVFHQNLLIIGLLTLSLIWLIWKNPKGNRIVKMIVSGLLGGYLFLVIFTPQLFNWTNLDSQGIFTKLLATSTLVYLAGVALATGLYIGNRGLKQRMWFYMISALVLSAPFAIITPYGGRCAFGSVTFILLAALDVMREAIGERISAASGLTVSSWLLGTIALVGMVMIMSLNGHYNEQRISQMQQQAAEGNKTLVLKRLPFDGYNWNTDPTTRWGWGYPMMFKQAHLNPKHYTLIFEPFKN